MPQTQIVSATGAVVSTLDLSERVFGAKINIPLVHQSVIRYLANQRQGTHSTKTRGEVRGTTRKWYKQKGTGRARHGDQRAPIFRGGGITFGPKPRDYRQDMPRKMRQQALRVALSAKLASGALTIVDDVSFDKPKTKQMVAFLNAVAPEWRKALLVLSSPDTNVLLSARNIPYLRTAQAVNLNTYEVVDAERIIMTRSALAQVEGVLNNGAV